ncbi:MAG: hypothetical protein K2X08_08555, partial [Chlamydiales bacterium]|nr:hypothetical protein [Chlamydiales bacterium]
MLFFRGFDKYRAIYSFCICGFYCPLLTAQEDVAKKPLFVPILAFEEFIERVQGGFPMYMDRSLIAGKFVD